MKRQPKPPYKRLSVQSQVLWHVRHTFRTLVAVLTVYALTGMSL